MAKLVGRFIMVGAISSHYDSCLTGTIQERRGRPMEEDEDPAWLVGPRRIEINDLVLVRPDHVSKGSWQVHLQLLHPLRPR